MSLLKAHFLRGICKSLLLCLVVSLIIGFGLYSGAQSPASAQPKISDQSLGVDQLAVYKAILATWMYDGKQSLNLATQTDLFPIDGAFDSRDCLKGLDLEPVQEGVVHRFRPEDVASLKPANVRLVDREAQEKEVDNNDPGKAIRQGKSIDSALRNGFAHGIAWFSEIRFDKSHIHAVVFYGFRCGSLCGNGGTAILEKENGEWKLKSQCGSWES
jgi:hypothetical protein